MFWVIEIQCENGKWSQIITQHDTLHEAESKFYLVLSYAAISTVEVKGAILFDDKGIYFKREVYYHGQEEPDKEAK